MRCRAAPRRSRAPPEERETGATPPAPGPGRLGVPVGPHSPLHRFAIRLPSESLQVAAPGLKACLVRLQPHQLPPLAPVCVPAAVRCRGHGAGPEQEGAHRGRSNPLLSDSAKVCPMLPSRDHWLWGPWAGVLECWALPGQLTETPVTESLGYLVY